MELNLRTVLVILGSIIMLGILVDGFRRMRRARKDALRIDVKGDFKFPEDSFPSELPNGGARIVGSVNAEDLLQDAKKFRDQLDSLPVMSALDSLEANAEQVLDTDIKNRMQEERIYAGEPDFQHDSYADTDNSRQNSEPQYYQQQAKQSDSTAPVQQESKNLSKETDDARDLAIEVKSDSEIDSSSLVPQKVAEKITEKVEEKITEKAAERIEDKVAEKTVKKVAEKVAERVAPRTRPLNLDQHVPLLTDVEELGEDVDAHSTASAVGSAIDNAVDSVTESIELTIKDVDGIKTAVGDISNFLSTDDLTENHTVTTDRDDLDAGIDEYLDEDNDHQQAQEMMAQAAYAPVKKPGPNAEILSERPVPSLVLVTHVIPHDEEGFCGEDILYLVNSCDLRHGEKEIFHRFEQEGGEGCIEFSMANSFNPGIFDPNTLIHERIHGISLFMSLPGPTKAMNAFESMTEMASVIARNLGGDVHDETHSIMALQTIEHNRQLVRDFVRKQKLTGKK